MKNKEVKDTKLCKHCQTEISKKAKVCPNCRKKQGGGCLGFIIAIIILFVVLPTFIGGEEKEQKKQETLSKDYVVGDTVSFDNVSIKYISADKYTTENEFLQPQEGTEYYRIEFEFENTGTDSWTISSMTNWNCYADGYSVKQCWINNDDDLSGTMSAGKKIKGALYFEIPVNAEEIVLEYKNNIWLDDILRFIVK